MNSTFYLKRNLTSGDKTYTEAELLVIRRDEDIAPYKLDSSSPINTLDVFLALGKSKQEAEFLSNWMDQLDSMDRTACRMS